MFHVVNVHDKIVRVLKQEAPRLWQGMLHVRGICAVCVLVYYVCSQILRGNHIKF